MPAGSISSSTAVGKSAEALLLVCSDNRDLKSLALQCPLHVDKSPNVLKPHLPFTLTCSAVVGLTSVRAIPNVESITMRRSTLEVKDVVVATMNETGKTTTSREWCWKMLSFWRGKGRGANTAFRVDMDQ